MRAGGAKRRPCGAGSQARSYIGHSAPSGAKEADRWPRGVARLFDGAWRSLRQACCCWPAARRSSCRHCPQRLRPSPRRGRRRARRRAALPSPLRARPRSRCRCRRSRCRRSSPPRRCRKRTPFRRPSPRTFPEPALTFATPAFEPGRQAMTRDDELRSILFGLERGSEIKVLSLGSLAGGPADRGACLHPAGAGRRRSPHRASPRRQRAGRRSSSSPASTATSRPAARR